jgi:hypothetical protein
MTQSRIIAISAVLLLCTVASPRLSAQFRSEWAAAPPPSVLSPDPSVWWIGPQLGANLITHDGDFITDFCKCSFQDGSGVGVTAGLEIGHMLSPMFGIAIKALYMGMGADYSYFIMDQAVLKETGETVEARFERQNRIELGYLMLHPVLQFHPFTGGYVFLGPGVGINTTGTTEYTVKPADDRYEFDLGDPNQRLVQEDAGDIPEVEKLRLDFRVGVGANIRLGRSFVFSPEVSYNLPLTTISADDNWEATAIHLIGVFKFEL